MPCSSGPGGRLGHVRDPSVRKDGDLIDVLIDTSVLSPRPARSSGG